MFRNSRLNVNYRKRRRQHVFEQRAYIAGLPDLDHRFVNNSQQSSSDNDSFIQFENNPDDSEESVFHEDIFQPENNPQKKEFMEACLFSILSHCNLHSSEIVVNLFNCASSRFFSDLLTFPNVRHFWNKQASKNNVEVYIICQRSHSHGPFTGEPKNYNCYECNGESVQASLGNGNYFLHLPLRKQLEKYLPSIPSNFWQDSTNEGIDDIADAKAAADVKLNSSENISRMTLTLHSDEISCSNSSSNKIFPIFITINELKPFHRRKFFLLVGLYVGKEKPAVDIYLTPICDEIKGLSEDPVQWNLSESHSGGTTFHLVALIADAPMRAYLRNVKQFNHIHGCDWCLIQATSANGARIFSNSTRDDLERMRRTKKDFLDYKDLFRSENCVDAFNFALNPRFKGINGVSPLLSLSDFDIVNGVCVEPMHSISLGVFRNMIIKGILGSEDGGNVFAKNIQKSNFIEQIGSRLECIKVPSEIIRAPRHISQSKFWKSNEWDSFLMYFFYSTARGLLKPALINLICVLNRVYYITHVGPVHDLAIQEIRNLVEEYQQGTATLFGSGFLSYNLHILSHLADSFRFLGPNSGVSSYPLEDRMGYLKRKVRRFSHVGPALTRVFVNDLNYEEYLATKINKWSLNAKERKCFGITNYDNCTTKTENKNIPREYKEKILNAFRSHFNRNISFSDLKFFKTMIHKGIRYSTRNYCTQKQRDDSYVSTSSEFYHINAIAELNQKVYILGQKIFTRCVSLEFQGFTGFFSFPLDNVNEVNKIQCNFDCLEIDSIRSKCIYIKSSSFYYTYKKDMIVTPFLKNK